MANRFKISPRLSICVAASAALLLSVGQAEAEVRAQRFPVTAERILEAIGNHQLPTQRVQLTLSVPMTTPSPTSQLDVQEVSKTSATSARLRIACHQRGECLPFFVTASWPESLSFVQPSVPAALPASASNQSVSTGATDRHPARLQELAAQPGTSTQPTIRSGSPATLLFEDQKLQIRVQVVCLQDGSDGAHIRVQTTDRKHTFTAEVVMPGLVRGSL